MILDPVFQLVGQFLIVIVVAVFALLFLTLILGRILLKKDMLIFPKLLIFVSDAFYSPLKGLARWLGFDDMMVDQISVEVRNQINKKEFNDTDNKKKILVLPHCLRDKNCQAPLDETGLVCDCCGKCSIGVIKTKAESIGYKVFIIPGSSFMKKILKDYEFDSVLGVACYEDLNLTMMKLNDYKPQGVLLSRTGCFETKVDVRTVLEKIGYFDKNKEDIDEPNLDIHPEFCVDKNKTQ